MNTDDSYLQVKWTRTSYDRQNRTVLKIPKDNVRFMTKSQLSEDPLIDKDGYSYISSIGDVYIKYESRLLKSKREIIDYDMILPLHLLLFRYQWIYPQNTYKMKCRCSEKGSKFDFLLINPTINEVLEGIIDKISEYNIKLLSDINICLEDECIVGVYFKYEDNNGKIQKFLGR